MSAKRVVVVGGLNYDFVFVAPRLPRPGETTPGTAFSTTLGGKAGNQAVAAARARAQPGAVSMVGRVGDDWMGREMIAGLERDGIDCSAVATSQTSTTGVAAIMQDASGENTVTPVYGANAECDEQQVAAATALLEGAAALLLQFEIPWAVSAACAAAARASDVPVILDPAPVVELPEGAFTDIDILTPNQGEAERWSGVAVTGPASAAEAAARLRELGVATVIVTLGTDGVVVDSVEFSGHLPGHEVSVASTLAAGDAFCGGLAAAFAEALSLPEAIERAQVVAALSVTREGAQDSMPSRPEIDAFAEKL